MRRSQEERKAAELFLAKSHLAFYEKEAAKDSDYDFIVVKWREIVESLQQ